MSTRFLHGITGLLLVSALAACGSGGGDGDGTRSAGDEQGLDSADCQLMSEIRYPIPETPLFTLDPLGPITDVTCDWQRYQPADEFCVRLDAPEFTPGGTGPLTAEGSDPECRFSGFTAADTGLYPVQIATPPLCAGCRRLFIDLSQMPEDRPGELIHYAHGHAFYAIASLNPTYTIEPIAHSPNTKNFTNDYLVSPPGTILANLVGATDLYLKAYVTHTTRFAHTGVQGPYYIGPWYVNRAGERIHGVYVDVDVASAQDLGEPNLNAIRYLAGYNSGTLTCPDNLLGLGGLNFLYAGCVDRAGTSSSALNPYP